MQKRRRFKNKTAPRKRVYRQEISIIRSNVKTQMSKLAGWFKKLREIKYVKS